MASALRKAPAEQEATGDPEAPRNFFGEAKVEREQWGLATTRGPECPQAVEIAGFAAMEAREEDLGLEPCWRMAGMHW